ncbi:MAG: helix-turn-helix domain-containing protein [Rhodospirillaceae bacterium]|nr:helix-turn-helix domain-containing protein [Rhodospirillaceae bacterium]
MAAVVKSAERVLTVLALFARLRRPLALKDICAELDYPQSSASVLLKSLTALGYLFYNRHRRVYFPALRVAALGDWVAHAVLGESRLLDALWAVRDATGEQTAIAIQNDVYLQYIRLLPPADDVRFHIDEGAMMPLARSVVGWTLLSTLNDRAAEAIVRRARLAGGTPQASPGVAEIMAAIARIRRTGYGYVENRPFDGVAALCVVLPIRILDQSAVLGLGGPLERVKTNRARYLAILKEAAGTVVGSLALSAGQ